MGFPRLDVAHIFFPHAPLLMTGRTRVPLALLPAPFLVNLASLSWGEAFLEVPISKIPSKESTSFEESVRRLPPDQRQRRQGKVSAEHPHALAGGSWVHPSLAQIVNPLLPTIGRLS